MHGFYVKLAIWDLIYEELCDFTAHIVLLWY